MNKKFCFLLIVFLFLLTSCSSSNNESSSEEVVFDDGYKTAKNGEVIIDDSSFEGKEAAMTDSSVRTGSRDVTQIAGDGSQIEIMYDNLGNKTETRKFNNSLLKFVLLRTAADGSRQVFVYGQNGMVNSLPENMLDKVLTAPSNELANAAGIFEGIKEQPSFTQNNQLPSVTTLKPLPSSQFPIRNQQVEQTPPQETEEPSDSNEKPQTVENKNNDKPTANADTQSSLNKKSDEQQ